MSRDSPAQAGPLTPWEEPGLYIGCLWVGLLADKALAGELAEELAEPARGWDPGSPRLQYPRDLHLLCDCPCRDFFTCEMGLVPVMRLTEGLSELTVL